MLNQFRHYVELRKARGWDQTKLAAAGINSSVISRVERGRQSDLKASVLVALACALEVSVAELLVEERKGRPAEADGPLLDEYSIRFRQESVL